MHDVVAQFTVSYTLVFVFCCLDVFFVSRHPLGRWLGREINGDESSIFVKDFWVLVSVGRRCFLYRVWSHVVAGGGSATVAFGGRGQELAVFVLGGGAPACLPKIERPLDAARQQAVAA